MTQNERLDFLINHLISEDNRYSNIVIPKDSEEKFNLFRSLVNVREPKQISNEFIKLQDDYLQERLTEINITDAYDLQAISNKLYLWQGDRTTLKCGAIVNAANSAMLGCFVPCHKCIDNAIHTFSGVQLRLECNRIMKLQGHKEQTGAAKITKSYNLPCDYILHTVGPIVYGHLTDEHRKLLASCYRSCLELAESNGVKSIAFCCISTGEFHFPNDIAAQIAVETAKDYLISHFSPFASDMADMMKQAFEEEWIDFYPKKGKVGGAFCANLPFVKQSRVLTNFDGNIGDVVTLAHELGHAYHGMMIEDHRILNTDYSMPVAETASTFNENIIMNAVIEEASDEEKLVLLENQLQDLTQIMCDIYSRFLFESEVFERRKNEFLFSKDLEEIMLNAQKTAYGDGLDPNYLHPYMWVNKGHYYSSQLSFYNFPYAFGLLFAKGLYAEYLKKGSDFVSEYERLLSITGKNKIADITKEVGIDIHDKEFWNNSLKTIEEDIEKFIMLSKKH